MTFRKLILIALCIILCSCHHGGAVQKEDDSSLDFQGADVEGLNDPLETKVVIKVGSIGLNLKGGASFFRGYIDKTTTIPDYQLYIQTRLGGGWRYWDMVRYLSPVGLKQYPVTRVATDVKCSYMDCGYFEDLILTIDRSTLLNWSSKETTLRLSSSKVSGNKDIEVSDRDAKDFLDAMDKVTSYFESLKKQLPMPGPTTVK